MSACSCCRPIGRRALLASAGAFLLSRPAASDTLDACGSPGVRIEVRGATTPVRYDFSATRNSLRQLQQQALGAESARTNHGTSVVGMTVCRFHATSRVRVFQATVGGQSCLVPSHIEVDFSQLEHTILVAADGPPPGSCGRGVVMDHEARHAKINDRTIGDGRGRVEFALRRLRPKLGPVWNRGLAPDEAAGRFLAALKPHIDEAIAKAMETNRQDNGAMDKPNAYARDWARCGGIPG